MYIIRSSPRPPSIVPLVTADPFPFREPCSCEIVFLEVGHKPRRVHVPAPFTVRIEKESIGTDSKHDGALRWIWLMSRG